MKALSLRQPWAWLVVHGGKLIENRRWNTRFRGQFMIHAAQGMTATEYLDACAFARRVSPSLEVPPFEQIKRGGFVGRARLVDVIDPCIGVRCAHPWHMPEQFGFVLEDVEPVEFKPARGALNFFEVDA